MTEAEPAFDSHAVVTMDAYHPSFLMNSKDAMVTSTTIADHINYQLSQIDASYTANNTSNKDSTAITTFMNNHTANQDLIDRSNTNQVEHVLEWSPNKRYCRLNTLLGKGAFKVVHKAMDREEGYEVAWNVLHVRFLSLSLFLSLVQHEYLQPRRLCVDWI